MCGSGVRRALVTPPCQQALPQRRRREAIGMLFIDALDLLFPLTAFLLLVFVLCGGWR